jgi:hypothetical protein
MKKVMVVLLIFSLFGVVSCSTSKKIQAVQFGDEKLSTDGLLAELKKLDDAQEDVNSKKGMTGTNVASALFWLPGLAYTYYDAGEANGLIEQRRAHLRALYSKKQDSKKQKSS